MNNANLPIVIGVTGHRQIRSEDYGVLKEAVKKELSTVLLSCANTPVKLICCLAEGADMLCAEAAIELNIGLIAALPMELSEYRKDFYGDALFQFDEIISKTERCIVTPHIEEKKSEEEKFEEEKSGRDYLYRQADIFIVEHSHCLIALYDGASSKSSCGAAATVDMALNHSYLEKKKKIRHDRGYVIHIYTPRDKADYPVGTVLEYGDKTHFFDSMKKLDELNKEGGDADSLSLLNADKYRRLLMYIAFCGTVLASAFLLYDDVAINCMLIVCGFILAMMFLLYKKAKLSGYHTKYLEYRVLAECIRVQKYLLGIGSSLEIADIISWGQFYDTAWILNVMKAFTLVNDYPDEFLRPVYWIDEQASYHENAAAKTAKKIKRNNSLVSFTMIFSTLIYFAALVYEYIVVGKFDINEELIRIIIKVTLGALSAAGVFIANYFGKLSLDRVYDDHIKMQKFFSSAREQYDRFDDIEVLIMELASEELAENSDWYSYEKNNEIDLVV